MIVQTELICAACGATAEDRAPRWRMYRTDDPELEEEPQLAAYCPDCANRNSGSRKPHSDS